MFRRHLLLARTGWLVQQPLISLTNTTPSAPSTVASQHSIDGAASPPRLRRGILLRLQDFPASQANWASAHSPTSVRWRWTASLLINGWGSAGPRNRRALSLSSVLSWTV